MMKIHYVLLKDFVLQMHETFIKQENELKLSLRIFLVYALHHIDFAFKKLIFLNERKENRYL